MATLYSPKIVTNGLVLALDAANIKGYDRYENLALNSEAINSWDNNGNAIAISANSQLAPNGTLTADVLSQTAVINASRWVSSTKTRTYTAGVTYTLSIWLKKISGTDAQPTIQLWVNGGTQQSIGTITTEWVRYSRSFTPASTISSNTFSGLNIGWSDQGGANNFTFAAWGFQIEVGATATDYYPTTSSTKTRGTTWFDLSSFNNNFGIFNGVTYSNNPSKFIFDGVDDNVGLTSVPANLQLKNDKTIICWWKQYSTGDDDTVALIRVGLGTDLLYSLFSTRSTGQLSYQWYNNNFLNVWSTGRFTVNTFNFGAVTINGTTATFYINGIPAGTGTVSVPSPASATEVGIGASRAGGVVGTTAQDLAGEIAMVQVYNRALTAQEILQNFNATRSRFGV